MKKSKLLMPIIGITTLSTIAMPLASCSCNKKDDTSTRDISIDVTLSSKVSCKTSVLSSGDYSVVLTCKDNTKYIPKIRSIIVGIYVLRDNEYSYDLKEQTVVIKKDVINNNSGWITVLPELPQDIAVESIKVTPPTKTEYNAGDHLDLTGMVVTANYNNGKSETITEGYTTTPSVDDELQDTDTQVTVTYKEKTDKFTIQVNPVAANNFINLTATAETTLTWTKGAEGSKLQFSTDGGNNWNNVENDITFGNESTPSIQLKGTLVNDGTSSTGINNIKIASAQPTVTLSGSLMNLLLKDDKPATNLVDYAFTSLFSGSTGLKSIVETSEKILLPCEELKQNCYLGMFSGCTGLTNAPKLPATSLEGADHCYQGMFVGCTSLVNAPALPAETLSKACYCNMFTSCTSLVNAPALPAGTLISQCYKEMFYNCSKLKVTTDGSGQYKQTIFTCPEYESTVSNPVSNMFKNTYETTITTPTSGTTYYCDTTPFEQVTVTLVNNDLTEAQSTVVVDKGFTIPEPAAPTRTDGPEFIGWYTEKPTDETSYWDETKKVDFSSYKFNSDTTLYARWGNEFNNRGWTNVINAINTFEASDQGDTAASALVLALTGFEGTPGEGQTVQQFLQDNLSGVVGTIKINNQYHYIRCIDALHDIMTDGTATSTSGKAALTFEMMNFLSDNNGNYLRCQWSLNSWDYTSSNVRANLTGNGGGTLKWYNYTSTELTEENRTALQMLPNDIQSAVKEVNKTVAKAPSSDSEYITTSYNDKLFLLTYTEMAQTSEIEEGTSYKYWADHNDNTFRIKKDASSGHSSYYWLASPCDDGSYEKVWYVSTTGAITTQTVGENKRNAISFAFCL